MLGSGEEIGMSAAGPDSTGDGQAGAACGEAHGPQSSDAPRSFHGRSLLSPQLPNDRLQAPAGETKLKVK